MKTALGIVLFLVLIITASFILIQLPSVQTTITNKATDWLYKRTGHRMQVELVDIEWFDRAVLNGINVFDLQGNMMLSVNKININFDIRNLFMEHKYFDKITITRGDIRVNKYTIDEPPNITIFLDSLKQALSAKKRRSEIRIQEIQASQCKITIHNWPKDSLHDLFNYNHFTIQNLDFNLSNMLIVNDTIQCRINALSGKDKETPFEIETFTANFRISQQALSFGNLEVTTPYSSVRDSLIFKYNGLKNLSHIVDSVDIYARLYKSAFHARDLGLFSPFFKKFDEPYQLTGIIDGKVKDLDVKNFLLVYGHNSRVQGNISLQGLPDLQTTFISANIGTSLFDTRDLVKFIPQKAHDPVTRFEHLYFTGSFRGQWEDTVSFNGSFSSDLGDFTTNLAVKFDDQGERHRYKGYLQTRDFHIGKFLGARELREVNFIGSIEGTGFDIENAEFDVQDASISSLGLTLGKQDYTLKNIETTAEFAEGFFKGNIQIDDPEHIIISADGLIDIRDHKDSINIRGTADTVFIKDLGLYDQLDFISGEFDLNFGGFDPFNFNIDSLTGRADFSNIYLSRDQRTHPIDWLIFETSENPGERMHLQSSNIGVNITGNFTYSRVFRDVRNLIKEYQLNVRNDQNELIDYYTDKLPGDQERYELEYKVNLININPLIHLFQAPPDSLSISHNTRIEGRIAGGISNIVDIYSEIDTIQLNGQYFYDNILELNSSKIIDSTDILAAFYLESGSQEFKNLTRTRDLLLGGIWNNNHIDFELNIQQVGINNFAVLRGDLDFLNDTISLKISPDSIQAFNHAWTIHPDNEIRLLKKEDGLDTKFRNFLFSSRNQSIFVGGTISRDPNEALMIEVEDLLMSNFNPILPKKITGIANGQFTLKKFPVEFNRHEIQIDTFNINIDSLSVENFLVGDVESTSKKAASNNYYNIDMFVNRNKRRIIDVQGIYIDSLTTNPLQLSASFDSANINFLEPFFGQYFSDITGYAHGDFNITGEFDYPVFEGRGYVSDGHLKVNYLNTAYNFDGNISFKNDTIDIEGLQIVDEGRNAGNLSGLITHKGFDDYHFNLDGDFQNLNLLNTTVRENSLFYGTGYGSGNIQFTGPVSNMSIYVYVTTSRDTRIYIPIGATSEIYHEEYINFVNFSEESEGEEDSDESSQGINLRGLNVDIDLEITPDAYCEIIFDQIAGDIIRGRGNGSLDLIIDSNGAFSMFGDFEFTEGWYNFTMYNIINKEFNILPESKITWRGDPYQGILNIQATYEQMASIAPLLNVENEEIQNPELNRKYPSQVMLDLQGPLLSPDIQFDISIDDVPYNLSTNISAFYNRIDNDEQELKRQVFSLIILRRFSPEDYYDTKGSIGSSVSEFVSNQLSYWISQVDENLEIDVDLGRLNQDALNTFQLRLSYTFMEGRLRVTRDGSFTNNQNRADVGSIIGDWTVEYLLDPDGQLRVKMFNKTNYRNLNQTYYTSIPFTAGFSIMWTQSFSEISDKIAEAQKRKKESEKKQTSLNNEGIIRDENEIF